MDENYKITASPFRYAEDSYYAWNVDGGISKRRLEKLWEKGMIGESELYLMEALKRFSVLTGKHILDVFYLSDPADGLIRLRVSDKNPYRHLIRNLVSLGVLYEGQLVTGDKKIGSKIYSLSGGAMEFMAEGYLSGKVNVSREIPSFYDENARKGSNLDYGTILSVMALNQMHVRLLANRRERFDSYGRIWSQGGVPANIYRAENGMWYVMIAPQRNKELFNGMGEMLETFMELQFNAGLLPGETCYVLLAEDLDSMFELWQHIPDETRKCVLFTTDQEVFSDRILERLLRVTGMNSYKYVSDSVIC